MYALVCGYESLHKNIYDWPTASTIFTYAQFVDREAMAETSVSVSDFPHTLVKSRKTAPSSPER